MCSQVKFEQDEPHSFLPMDIKPKYPRLSSGDIII